MKKLLMLLVAFTIFSSCTKKEYPKASFMYFGADTYAPDEVSFTNTSLNADDYEWDFGDNETSTDENPTHIYLRGGLYTVTLKVKNSDGEDTYSQTINVQNKPTRCKIKKLYVRSMPFTNPSTGSGWDSSDGPDVFFQLVDTNNNNNAILVEDDSTRIQNVTQSDLPIFWTWNQSYFSVPTLSEFYFINLVDYDPYSNNELIGYVSYKMSNYMTTQNHYPSVITLTQNNITIDLHVEWAQ